jgi:hypothetical protein
MTKEYSKAFERLVKLDDPADDDLVGLLAYATYKRDKRDYALSGENSEDDLKTHYKLLTPGLIEQYRANAFRRLEIYGEQVVLSAEPEIQERTRTEAITGSKDEIIRSVRDSTKWWLSIVLNVVAWLISLAITFLVAVGSGKISFNIIPGG